MGGFNRGSIAKDNEAEVENLLSQLEEESLLKLRANTHLKTDAFSAPLAADPNSGGLDDNLLVRFANLKARGPPKQSQAPIPAKNVEPELLEDDEEHDEEEDVLAAQLEERLKALKAEIQSPGGQSVSSLSSSRTSSSSSSSKSKSFSPLKMIKQLSMGRKSRAKPEDELISSVAKEIAEEKKKRQKQQKPKRGKSKGESVNIDSDEDEDDSDVDESHLLNDLDLKQLKKELNAASGEEDRLSREAQQVIDWAKDAARLEKTCGAGDEESDLEEELLCTAKHKADDLEEDETKLDSPNNHSKKKSKGKKWSFF